MLRLIDMAFQEACNRGIRLIFGDCSPDLLRFYLHLGYRTYAPSFSDPSYGLKIPLVMVARDHSWFAQVRSPLARAALCFPDDEEARLWIHHSSRAASSSADAIGS